MKPKCIMCGLVTQGRGQFHFSYLGETEYLCGRHAMKVMKYIRKNKLTEINK